MPSLQHFQATDEIGSIYDALLAHIMDRGSGAEQQLLHRDEDAWVHMPAERPELEMASIIAMVDMRDPGELLREGTLK